MSQAYVGRVVIELGANNNIYMEHYTNGARTRTRLDRGNEWWNIVDELHMQRKAAQSAQERKIEREAKATVSRHNRVWSNAAEKFGTGFAASRIGGDVPPGFGRYMLDEPSAKKKKTPTPGTTADELLALLGD